jgi:hypothetical protein
MTELEILKKLVVVGAAACNVDEKRALALLDRHIGKTPPAANKKLFYELCAALGQGEQTKYTTARANKLKLRLKTYSESDMLNAARAIASNDYMMGSSGRKYGTIDYLLRNDEQIDQWLQQDAAVQAAKAKATSRYSATPATTNKPEISDEQRAANLQRIADMKAKFKKERG